MLDDLFLRQCAHERAELTQVIINETKKRRAHFRYENAAVFASMAAFLWSGWNLEPEDFGMLNIGLMEPRSIVTLYCS